MRRSPMKLTIFGILAAVSLLVCCFLPTPHSESTQLTLSAQTQATASQVQRTWPVPTSRHITSFFGNRTISLYGTHRFHTGVDILAATGTEVLAMEAGTVLVSTYDGGWGNYLIVSHGDNLLSLYAHLNSRSVQRGETVRQGQSIGTVGNTGLSTAPHLHFELRENGVPINPFRYVFS